MTLAPLYLWLALLAQELPPPSGDVLADVQALQAEGAHAQALQRLEAELVTRPDDAGLQRARARALESFVDAGGPWLALEDARAAWDRALALEPGDLASECGAIAVRLRLGEYAEALAQAERALGAAWLAGGSAPPMLLELACRARLGTLPARDEGADSERMAERSAALAQVWAALRHASTLASDSSELVRLSAGLFESEGLTAHAAAQLVRALERNSGANELHQALLDLHVREGLEERLGPLYERWSAGSTNATLAWFTGQAWHLAGDLAQRERRFAPALEAYQRAGQWLAVAGTLEADRRAGAEVHGFRVQLSAGWCELESGALDAAGERLLALLRTHLERRDELDGLGRSLLQALETLVERRGERGDFARAANEARAVVTLLPEAGAWWHRLGFLLREHGTQLQAGMSADVPVRERETRAREVQHEAWQAYLRAVELLPTDARVGNDARVLNDAALVQIYHLRDNLAEAESLLERAVRAGEEGLATLAPESEGARSELARALGDAHQNLGYLNYHVYRQNERARDAFLLALGTDSGARPEIEPYLAALAGTRGPMPEADRSARVRAPLAAPRARAVPAWEATLAEARARAAEEGRALVVHVRGAGLSRELTSLEELVTEPEYVRASASALWLIGDAARHTFTDRRHDGRRVECPRHGLVTCAEHVRAHAELRAWFEPLLDEPPGESEEGLWILLPGAESPERVAEPRRLAELLTPATAPSSEPFEAVEASLGGEDGAGEARALVGTRTLSARLACERILWDGFRSSPARAHLLAVLAADTHPGSRELLAACARQGSDPELQRAALAVWPSGAELDPVVHAWHWSTDSEARAAAEAILRRERPQDGVWEALRVLVGD